MFFRNHLVPRADLIVARLSLLFLVSFLVSFGTSASTLTITDDNGEKAPLEIQSGDYVRVTTASDGDVFLVLKGFSVTVGDGSGGGTGGDTGSSGGDTGGTGGDAGSTGGDTGGTGGDAAEIYEELVASKVPDSRFVPAGVIATTRAQEHGYSLLYAG